MMTTYAWPHNTSDISYHCSSTVCVVNTHSSVHVHQCEVPYACVQSKHLLKLLSMVKKIFTETRKFYSVFHCE